MGVPHQNKSRFAFPSQSTFCGLDDVRPDVVHPLLWQKCSSLSQRYKRGIALRRPEGVQLTWMDAKVGNRVVTPQIGKLIEVNALWYNDLRVASIFSSLIC